MLCVGMNPVTLRVTGGRRASMAAFPRRASERSKERKKLAAALHSPEVKAFIVEKHKGAVVPAF